MACEPGMRPRAKPNIRQIAPVCHVVLTFVARLCPVGNLVLAVARLRQSRLGVFVHIRSDVFVGWRHFALAHPSEERCALFDDQRVEREMLRPKRNGAFERRLPGRQRLAWQGKDKIEIDACKAAVARRPTRLLALLWRVDAPPPLEQRRIEALCAHAQRLTPVARKLSSRSYSRAPGLASRVISAS